MTGNTTTVIFCLLLFVSVIRAGDPESANSNSISEKETAQVSAAIPCNSTQMIVGHHSGDEIMPGVGSAIFFHTEPIPVHGASDAQSMSEGNFKEMISRLDPCRSPLYVLLPKDEYSRKKPAWLLP